MNKTDLIDAIASAAELNKKQAKAALEATLAAITGSLKKGEPVQLIGFGTEIPNNADMPSCNFCKNKVKSVLNNSYSYLTPLK